MKIIADSGCDIIEKLKREQDVNVERVPLNLTLGENNYLDDEALDLNEYLREMGESLEGPKTSAPSPMLYLDKFMGRDSVFVVTISQFLSSSYQSALTAKEMYLEQFGQKFIHVFDGLSAAVGNTLIVMKINEFMKKNQTENEIVENVNSFISNMKTYIVLEKFDTLVKSGRVSPYIAKLATVLNIKPICMGVQGKIELFTKARGNKKAYEKLADAIAADKEADHGSKILGISHVQCLERALQVRDEIWKRVKFKDVLITEAGGIPTTYADKQGLIISY